MSQDPVRLPPVDSWDRSVESVAVTTSRGASQPVTADDDFWKIGGIWLSILGVVAAVAAAAGLRRREADGPVSVVRLVPHGRKGS